MQIDRERLAHVLAKALTGGGLSRPKSIDHTAIIKVLADIEAQGFVLTQVKPRRFFTWSEGDGDVLWFKDPISEPPYFGSPLCCGRTMLVEVTIGREQFEFPTQQTGGWPFNIEDEGGLWWIPVPDAKDMQAMIDAGKEEG